MYLLMEHFEGMELFHYVKSLKAQSSSGFLMAESAVGSLVH